MGAKQESYISLRDAISHAFRKKSKLPNSFMALDDVSFDVYPGESIGIIGKNGAGKSTLLKILSRITPPTSGRVIGYGRIASLLEVGTGFHPELSGRENVFMNGSILGMRKMEINRHFDEIVQFSGVEKFIDTPLKHFSSGMQLRLAFAVAAHLEPEILIIDEVLAVGDAAFQKKCLNKMDEVSKSGRTILFVSHDMNAIEQLCAKVILLQQGAVKEQGDSSSVISRYLNENKNYQAADFALANDVTLKELSFSPHEMVSGKTFALAVIIGHLLHEPPSIHDFCILIYSLKGIRVAVIDLRPFIKNFTRENNAISLNISVSDFNLVDGEYSIGLYYHINETRKEVLDLALIRVKPSPQADAVAIPYLPQYRGYLELINHIKIN
jgi:lipopolysaccharide transport system ATP-binding protein